MSDGEQEKQQPINNNNKGATTKVEAPAPAPDTKSQAAPVASEKPPLPPPDSTSGPTTPDPEKGQDSTVPPTTGEGEGEVPAEPGSGGPDEELRLQRQKRLLIIHTRLARFFTWLLLLGFVILPSTFTRSQAGKKQPDAGGAGSAPNTTTTDTSKHQGLNHITNNGLFAISYVCCLTSGLAVLWLWRIRKYNYEWVLTNLFSAGLINSFSGLITTFVNLFAVQGGQVGSSTKSSLVLTSCCTVIYAVLTYVYYQKRSRERAAAARNRRSRASATV